ncbi:MAG: tetratricopeptide repeat protein [Methylococcaceae bacterium]|nr:tetratricopeptide repeat protein [Methylococcaceae bacterium]
MTILKLITFVIVGLVTGCAGETVQESPVSAPVVKDASESVKTTEELAVEQKQATIVAQKKQRVTTIDPKVMYLLLTAELAGQRNQYDVALEGYMQAAKRVDDPRITERAAKIALFLEDGKKADTAVDLWLRQDVKNVDAHMLAALAALRAGRKAPALEHLEALLKLDPAGFDDTLLELLKSLGQPERAVFLSSVLDNLAVKHPNQAVIYFVQSLLAMQAKDNKLAAAKLTRALELQPAWDKALIAQSQLAVLNEDFEGAEKLLRDAVKKYPGDLKFKRMLAQVLIKASKFEDAVVEYRAILKEQPDDGDSMFSLALLHLQLQQDDEAKKYLDQLAGRPEWASQASYYLGKLAAKKGRFEQSLVWFDSVTNGSFELDAALSAVSVVVEQKHFEDAHVRLDKMQRKFPEQSLRLLAMRAEIYNDQKQYGKAYRLLSDALVKMPDQKELLYTRSLVSEHLGNLVAMEADLQAILRKHPDDVATLNALGYTLANKTQRFKEAERYLQKAMKLQPNVAVIVDSYGWLLFKQGQYDQARDYLQRAYAKQPQAEIAGHLAETLMKLNLVSEAKLLVEKALSMEPEDEYLLDLNRRFFGH